MQREKKRIPTHTHTRIWPNGNWIWYSNEVQLPDCIMWSLGILRSFRTETFRVNVFERDAVSKPKYTLSKTVRNNVSRDTKRTLTERLCKHPNPNGWKAKKAHTSCINLFNKNDSMFYSNEMWCNSLYANCGWHVLNRHRKSVVAHFGGGISVVSEMCMQFLKTSLLAFNGMIGSNWFWRILATSNGFALNLSAYVIKTVVKLLRDIFPSSFPSSYSSEASYSEQPSLYRL